MECASVIGSGIGGLASAIRLVAKGYEVHVFEKAAFPGGKIASFSEKGFRFDMGPSLFTLPHLFTELFELLGKKASDYIELVELPMKCNYFFPNGMNLKAWSDPQKFLDEIKKTTIPSRILNDYLEKQAFLFTNSSDFFIYNSIHKFSTYVGEAGQRSLKALPRLDVFKTMHQRNAKTFGDSNLTQLFDRYATYNGSDPYRAPATLNMIAHLEHHTEAYIPANGMQGIIDALVELLKEEGVHFHLNEEVTKLIGSGNLIKQIKTSKGIYTTDLVVTNADVTYFYKKLLPNKRMYDKLSKRERSSSALIFYWGINMVSDLDVHNILFCDDYHAEFQAMFGDKTFSDDLTIYIFISKKVIENDAPLGKENWFVMVNAPENIGQDWASLTSKVKDIALSKIKKDLKIDIEPLIETERIMTPVDIERRTGSVNGSLYGHSSNGAKAAFLKHSNFSRKYSNLFFVGGSVHPGGGIPLCIASAKIVDQLIDER